jgi:hypothetical protein
MSRQKASYTFERAYNVQHIGTYAGDGITSISRPDWPSFQDVLEFLVSAGDAPGDFILSPELITCADIRPGDLPSRRSLIADRIQTVKTLSIHIPESIILLGTPLFEDDDQPHNAVLFVRDGEEVGRTHKSFTQVQVEKESLHQSDMPDARRPRPHIAALISADLIHPPSIIDGANTLLVSSCWGAPAHPEGAGAVSDPQLQLALIDFTEQVFVDNPQLDTVVMTDRVPEGSRAIAPFNFVANRLEH